MAIANGRVEDFWRYAVDDGLCIGCGLCHERAPENFDVPEDQHFSSVTRQPAAETEETACLEAGEYCPTGGIFHEPGRPSADGVPSSHGGDEHDT